MYTILLANDLTIFVTQWASDNKTKKVYPLRAPWFTVLLIIYNFWGFLCFVLLVFALRFFQLFPESLDRSFCNVYSNITSFFRFANKRASYLFSIISLAHAPVIVTDFSIGSINCNPNNADRGCNITRVT
jgi:hypothetical protein